MIIPTNKKIIKKRSPYSILSPLSENLTLKKIIITMKRKGKGIGKIHDALRIKDELPKASGTSTKM